MAEFNEAVERASAGLEKKSRIMHEDEKLRVAYHESGPRPGRLLAAEHRSGPQGLDHSPRPGRAGLHDAAARAGPLPDDARRAGKPHPGAAGRHGRRGDDLRRHLHRRPERPGAGHRNRPQHGHGLRHEPAGPRQLPRDEPQPVPRHRRWKCRASQHHSEQTAREIDQEVKRIIDEGLQRTRHILETPPRRAGSHQPAADRSRK